MICLSNIMIIHGYFKSREVGVMYINIYTSPRFKYLNSAEYSSMESNSDFWKLSRLCWGVKKVACQFQEVNQYNIYRYLQFRLDFFQPEGVEVQPECSCTAGTSPCSSDPSWPCTACTMKDPKRQPGDP